MPILTNRFIAMNCIPINFNQLKFFFFSVLILISFFPHSSKAQYFFGRNKVNYNQFDWRVMQTEHFDIYFYPEMQELAALGADYAEEAYKILQAKFDHAINVKIPLIFYSSHFHFQETNVIPNLIPEGVGGFFEFIKGRVVIPANGSLYGFRHVIHHELVHVFSRSKIKRILKDNRKLDWTGLPLWFTEGLAEYWSIGWDSQTEMFIRDAIINNYFFPLQNLYQIRGSFLMYKEGQAFFRFISERYGENKIIQLFENYWKINRFSKVVEATLGVDFKQLDEEWVYSLKKKYYPILAANDLPGKVTKEITKNGINTKPAFFRLNSKPYVAFYANRSGYSNVYQKALEGENPKDFEAQVLVEGERTSEFESFHLLGSKLDVSNDGKLAFIAKSGEADAIYIYDLEAKEILDKLQFDNLIYLSSPAFSPEGDRIVFSAIDFSGKNDLYTTTLSDKSLNRLTNDFYDDKDPSWDPSNGSIVFSSDRTDYGMQGAYNIFKMDLSTYLIEHITYGNYQDSSPVWSPDSKYLAFTSNRDDAFNIWLIKPGIRYKRMPTQIAGIDNPDFSSSIELTETERYFTTLKNGPVATNIVEPVQLKKVTHFVTGAFDPEWTDEGNLIFTAFEKHSFQLRQLDNLKELFDRESEAELDLIVHKGNFWLKDHRNKKIAKGNLKYKKRFTLDVAQSFVVQDPTFGNYGGAQLSMSDILGNHQYHFLVYNDARQRSEFIKSFNVAVTKIDLSRRLNLSYGVYHLAGNFFNPEDQFFYERRYGGFFKVSYPISVFNRIETSLNVRESEKERFGLGQIRKALLVSNFISYVKDNTLWGRTGPVDGSRFNLTIGSTIDVQRSNVNFYTAIADYRKYFRLGQRVTLASRTLGSFNVGKEALKFFMGGSWDMRGYQRWSIWGENLVLFSQELRFPLLDALAIRFPFGGIGFNTIRGALFLDNGNAWNGSFDRLLGSYGIGARMNFIGFLVFRLDYGKKFYTEFNGFFPQKIVREPGTFTQFFFGFDF